MKKPKISKKIAIATIHLIICFFPLAPLQAEVNPSFDLEQKIVEAKAKLQEGLNAWDPEILKNARDLFLRLFMDNPDNAYLSYYIALCDYRLATYYFATFDQKEIERYTTEGLQYLETAMEADPAFAEPHALYATFLGYKIALDYNQAMTLSQDSYAHFEQALKKDPDNPRVNLLKGISILYTPEMYGGGADKAMEFLQKALELIQKEKVTDPVKPSWGKEEAYTFLGMAYVQKQEFAKAKELLQKTLEINPHFGLARDELQKLEKK